MLNKNIETILSLVTKPSIDEDLICIICHDPLLDPVIEPSCEQMFYHGCLETWCKKSNSCPHCRQDLGMLWTYQVCLDDKTLHIGKQKAIPPPQMINTTIDRLLVFCPVCFDNFERKVLIAHIPTCPKCKYAINALPFF